MTCSECKRRGWKKVQGPWNEAASQAMRADGWFVWAEGAGERFVGVVLCPDCRRKELCHDAWGDAYPVAELEDRASRVRS